jgi:hypothetical protein
MEFIVVTTNGETPTKRAYHSCSAIGNSLFIFGGIREDRTVLDDMYRYNVEENSWTHIEDRVPRSSSSNPDVSRSFPKGRLCRAPAVSHHTATVMNDRYIVVIGGWNGKKRTAEIFCFDTQNTIWRQIPERGEVPVGLSSHTACLMSSKDILIIGREGGVHTQRRFSGAFNLDIETGRYTEAPLHAASRSGHTANLIRVRTSKEYYLFVLGGRKSGGYELLGRWQHIERSTNRIPQSKIEKILANCTVCDEPDGRQHSQTLHIGERYLMVFGGEKWSGVRENVTNEAYILDCHKMAWYIIPVSDNIPRVVGHTMCGIGEKALVFGGSIHNKACDTLWQVNFVE